MHLVYTRGEFCDDAALARPSRFFFSFFASRCFTSLRFIVVMAEGSKSLLVGGKSSYQMKQIILLSYPFLFFRTYMSYN